jgi:predicted dehydrogenase
VRIGFLGCGMVAEMHRAAIERARGAELVGVFDPDPARARACGVEAYPNAAAMLADDDVEAVFVLTPTATHVELAIAVLRAGKHVLVEKPVARDREELRQLLREAEVAGTVCLPGHNYAYVPEIARMVRLVRHGSLGEIRLLSIVFAIAHREEVAERYDGVVRLVMPHHAYLAHRLMGVPASVQAGVTEPGWDRLRRHDQCWIALDYPPRGTGLLFASLGVDDESADPWTFVVKALGTQGSASATWRTGVWKSAIGSMSTAFAPYEEAYELQLEAFCRAVRGDPSRVQSTLQDAIAAERILSAAEAAIRTRGAAPLGAGVRHDDKGRTS